MKLIAVVALLSGGCDVLFRLDHVPSPDAAPPSVGRWMEVEAGEGQTCAIDNDQHLWCWGRNYAGEVGVGSTSSEIDEPQEVTDSTWSSISARDRSVCGIKTDGTLWCWGRNLESQLGLGTTSEVRAPMQVDGTWLEVSEGGAHGCGIKVDHSLWCWGGNQAGQIGDGTTLPRPTPVPINAGTEYLHVAAGALNPNAVPMSSTCAIAMDGGLWCWGSNDRGQLGIGVVGGVQPTPKLVAAGPYSTVSFGFDFACGITEGKLRCWGSNTLGQAGDSSLALHNAPSPVLIDGLDRDWWRDVRTGFAHACARTDTSRVFCWGTSAEGQLGTETGFVTPKELAPPDGATWLALATGNNHNCLLENDHRLWCIGADGYGQLGDGGSSSVIPVHAADGFDDVDVGGAHSCARSVSGPTACTGSNVHGQLGIATQAFAKQTFTPLVETYDVVSAGDNSTCGIANGTVWCWGGNYVGQISNGTYNDAVTPHAVVAGGSVSAEFATACSIGGVTKYLSCWGHNDTGQVGNKMKLANGGVTAPFAIPTQVWNAVATGYKHTCAIDGGGVVRCWGNNDYGQLDSGNTVENLDPMKASLTSNVTRIFAGGFHSCAIAPPDQLFCWGANYVGQLGFADFNSRTSAVRIAGSWKTVSLGYDYSCGVQTNGTLWCWGYNNRGQLGLGTRANQLTPAQVGTDTTWSTVSANFETTCGTKTDRSLWCWGANDTGQLGTNNAWRTALIQVP